MLIFIKVILILAVGIFAITLIDMFFGISLSNMIIISIIIALMVLLLLFSSNIRDMKKYNGSYTSTIIEHITNCDIGGNDGGGENNCDGGGGGNGGCG